MLPPRGVLNADTGHHVLECDVVSITDPLDRTNQRALDRNDRDRVDK
jgi:hypothetical protein